MMANELAVITPSDWSSMQSQAKALVDSGFLPSSVNTPQKAVAIMMLGRELGIAPWAALTSVNVIQGKPTVSPQLMLALINRSGQLEDMVMESTDTGCKVTMTRKGRTPHSEEFTMQDAAALGLTSKDNYRKQPGTMLKWRAVAACARVVFADVILGLYTPEEMGADVTADDQGNMTVVNVPVQNRRVNVETGEVVEGKIVTPELEAPAPAPTPEPPPTTPHIVPKQESNPLDDFGLESANAGKPVPDTLKPVLRTEAEKQGYQHVMKTPALKSALGVKNAADFDNVVANLKLEDKAVDTFDNLLGELYAKAGMKYYKDVA